MSKRGDNIHKRKDGRWEGRYKNGRKPDGRIRYGSVYGRSYREVKEKLEIISSEGGKTLLSRKTEKCFDEVLALWMENNKLRLKGGTINKYQNLIDAHISPELGAIRLSELTSTRINSFLLSFLLGFQFIKIPFCLLIVFFLLVFFNINSFFFQDKS